MTMIKGFLAAALLTATVAKADPPAVHGMLLFGDKVTYASHLPMFHAPHDYQLIMKLELQDQEVDAPTLAYYDEAKESGEVFFTLVPERMDLTEVIDGSKASFKAFVYLGHFERGGQQLPGSGVIVTVESMVYAAKLEADQLSASRASYLLFGHNGEYFAAHLIGSKPSFDAISTISKPRKMVEISCGRGACPDTVFPPVVDSKLPVTVMTSILGFPEPGDLLGSPYHGVHATINDILYLEVDELAH